MTIDGRSIRELAAAKRAASAAGAEVDEIMREPAVCKATGWSHATLWKRVASGEFSKPVKLGARAVGWFASDVIKHQEKLRAQHEAA